MTTAAEAFEEQRDSVPDAERLVVDVDGYEGPIDVLLTLAREQKVDLKKISILQLVEQYLQFVQAARRVKLELAADYLVVAAWLAYLKSRLLLRKTTSRPARLWPKRWLSSCSASRRCSRWRSS